MKMHTLFGNLRRFAAIGACALALAAAAPAMADTDYTDHWQNPTQTGWGAALTQGTNLIYTEIFHYNAGDAPTWFGGTLYKVADGHYSGSLYTVSGDYYGHKPYDPTVFTAVQAGSMDFLASDPNHATFTFIINGVTVTTAMERFTFEGFSVAGDYFGAFIQQLSADCNQSGVASVDYVPAQISISQSAVPGGTVTIQFSDVTSPYPLFYAMQGAATQYGKVLDIPTAAYANPDQSFTPLHIYDLRRTANGGIEGRWKTISGTSDKCVDRGTFSGVNQVTD
jgi:hypothetical protein